MIHMRPGLLTQLATESAVRREGNTWITATDNIVVPGRGYEGTGPADQVVGATEWMYSTPMVDVWRGPVVHTPEFGKLPQAVSRNTNDVFVAAQRTVLAVFDDNCGHHAVEVNR